MQFSIKNGSFYFNDKKIFLNSGEIHYFRINRELWEKHLLSAKEAGLTTVSTYVPWAWHEFEEHVFDFDGFSIPERDLNGWFRLCLELGLTCIVKPGPFILAEFRGAGLPDWLLEQYSHEIKMHNRKGEIVQSDGVSLFHPVFLEKVIRWYDEIMPFIAEREVTTDGPIIMMQICNEIGVFTWLAKQADYSHAVKDQFIQYLSGKYSDIAILNNLWGTDYRNFAHIELPPDCKIPYTSKWDRGRDYEWHCFWRTYYGDYLRMLSKMARERGVTVPLYHNLPGWIYGRGHEFPVNITMYEDLFNDKSNIVFGVDHIPEYTSYRNMHDDRVINDITIAMQGDKPLFAAEFQCGSREFNVVTNQRELELFYKASIANGLVGWNYYMFSQGRNPKRKGHSGKTFYWYTPLTAKAEQSSAFQLVERMSKIVKTLENLILNARPVAEICVLFYPPYYSTELERPVEQQCELVYTPSAIRTPAYFDGLLKAFHILNIDYDMIDLSKVTADKLLRYKQVWAFITDEMNAKDQQTIIDFTKNGGHIIIFPYLPDREMSQKPCTIIRDALSIFPSGREIVDSPLIDIFDFEDIKCSNPQITYSEESLADEEIIARTIQGSVCGFEKKLGTGIITHLGTWLGFDTEGHKYVYESILKKSDALLRHAYATNDNITVRERFTDFGSAMLFIGNYYNERQTGRVIYTHPVTNEKITIPFAQNEITLPTIYGVLSPICLEITEGLKILHCTSDILGINEIDNQIEIILYGDRDLTGEIVLEGWKIKHIKSTTITGKSIYVSYNNERVSFIYRHEHQKQLVLNINIG